MSRESIYEIACEMLQTTNVFHKDVSNLKYTNRHNEEISLLLLIKSDTAKYFRFHGKTEKNLQYAYAAIADAMPKYLDSGYSAPFSFKQQIKESFITWLDIIGEKYDIANPYIPEDLTLSINERDTGIAMLKLLHAREGITYEGMHTALDIDVRAIQKNLVKISPSMYSGDKKPYAPLRLGGQPLYADIELVQPEKHASEKRFRTLNSVHPLVLQENIMQLATLLKALCHQYYEYQDDLSRLIAIDIWYQLSNYAQNKIISYFAFDDQSLADFIGELDNKFPDDHVCAAYRTEKELLKEIEMPVDQALPYLMKAQSRIGKILLNTGKFFLVKQLMPVICNDDARAYEALDDEGNTIIFTQDQVVDIKII